MANNPESTHLDPSARPSAAQITVNLAPSVHSGHYAAALTSSAGFELPEGMKLYRGNNASGSSKQRSRLGDDDPALYLSGHDDVMFYHNNNWIPKPLTPDGKRPPDKESYSRHAFKDDSDPSADWSARVAARRDLGDAFGSKKAKATVRAQDRLKIDASHMTAMLEEVGDGIDE
ncbi:hypothetical protein A4X06_0g8515 [Tilletia controversa]|uniref:Uncharacterized protein n=1 Tax=Tilletia controversa TaxID=13291 RepID=A0A8X7MK00_9BASI|nr:hypothetical protein A4X06_0g8515 [Tilletia controversa]